MPDVFILGAGFSKAISKAMPTMADLSTEVFQRLKEMASYDDSVIYVPDTLYDLGNNVEFWMTYLSQPQPWLRQEHHQRNLALARDIRNLIREVITRRKACSMQKPAPDWLTTLIQQWHSQRASVITLNYDTLVESASLKQVVDTDKPILPDHMYPPYFARVASRSGGGLFGEGYMETFSYLKLHGSTNWYYSGRDDFYGETIFYSYALPWEASNSLNDKAVPRQARDKECLIIPPVTDKLTYFNNETIRRLWQEASEALWSATRVFIIGYSLPPSDLGMKFFLQHSQPSKETQASWYIVDRNASVLARYQELLPKQEVIGKYAGIKTAVSDFVQRYPKSL